MLMRLMTSFYIICQHCLCLAIKFKWTEPPQLTTWYNKHTNNTPHDVWCPMLLSTLCIAVSGYDERCAMSNPRRCCQWALYSHPPHSSQTVKSHAWSTKTLRRMNAMYVFCIHLHGSHRALWEWHWYWNAVRMICTFCKYFMCILWTSQTDVHKVYIYIIWCSFYSHFVG